MFDLSESSEPIDLVTLTNILKDRGELDRIGGAIYLAKLIDEVPRTVNAEHYAKIIHDKATLRRLIEKGYAIIKNCFDQQESVAEIIDFAESCILEVSERKIKPSFFEISMSPRSFPYGSVVFRQVRAPSRSKEARRSPSFDLNLDALR